MRRASRLASVLAVLVTAVGPALADGQIATIITPADQARLDAYEGTRIDALKQARAEGDAGDIAVLDAVTARRDIPWQGFDITGKWKCRTIKAGKLAALVVYGWFDCAVTDEGSGWHLRKLTGSQRTAGRFFDDGEARMTYLGVGTVNDDPAPPYGSGPQSDEPGYAFRNDNNGWRIEFPAPYYESMLDILEFRRR